MSLTSITCNILFSLTWLNIVSCEISHSSRICSTHRRTFCSLYPDKFNGGLPPSWKIVSIGGKPFLCLWWVPSWILCCHWYISMTHLLPSRRVAISLLMIWNWSVPLRTATLLNFLDKHSSGSTLDICNTPAQFWLLLWVYGTVQRGSHSCLKLNQSMLYGS